MDWLLNGMIVAITAGYAGLLYPLWRQRAMLRQQALWLGTTLIVGALGALLLITPFPLPAVDRITPGFILALLILITLTLFGRVMLSQTQLAIRRNLMALWLGISILWLVALVGAAVLTDHPLVIGNDGWIIASITQANLVSGVFVSGFIIASLLLLGSEFYAFYAAALPESANRALYRVIDAALLLLGIVLAISGIAVVNIIGLMLMLAGQAGLVYASTTYRVFDLRQGISTTLQIITLLFITSIVLFGALNISDSLGATSRIERGFILLVVAVLMAIIYLPARVALDKLYTRLLRHQKPDVATITRLFSQQVSQSVELNPLLEVVNDTLKTSLGVRRSGMLLINDTRQEGKIGMIVKGPAAQELGDLRGNLSTYGPVYTQLAVNEKPLSHFDIEFNPLYESTPVAERDYLRSLRMAAYAPIVVEKALIGILMCSAKSNDTPFYDRDLELLLTLANQTGVAVRNARLMDDMRLLNRNMTRLNASLKDANDQMKKLDGVKTDFVTIASHELRTPLAQLRGYIDILDSLDEMEAEQAASIVSNLRRASERMETLIAAMLDVSQIDVNAMNLNFEATTIDHIVRTAVEPLMDVLKQRKQTLSARELRNLPGLEADPERLVQAIQNVVVNAIKFTPDGGRIDITGQAEANDEDQPGIRLTISDSGVGINHENLELIFQKFYRAFDPGLHSTGTYKFMGAGPGLGLTITRGVIEGHGGKIWAESPGYNPQTFPGSTFSIWLPLHPADRPLSLANPPLR